MCCFKMLHSYSVSILDFLLSKAHFILYIPFNILSDKNVSICFTAQRAQNNGALHSSIAGA